jgi:hypothetical protein
MSTRFTLDGNYFSGSIPSGKSKLKLSFARVGSHHACKARDCHPTIPSPTTTPPTLHPIAPELGLMTSLEYAFYLPDQDFSHTIPSELGLMTGMTEYLLLENNKLTGTVPTELGNMVVLNAYFEFNSNSLTGKVPTELGNLRSISKDFFLSQNSFTGNVPSELGQLNQLTGAQRRLPPTTRVLTPNRQCPTPTPPTLQSHTIPDARRPTP